jgi:uncharacterized metal-binding protein
MDEVKYPICAKCSVRACDPHGPRESTRVDTNAGPGFCPMKSNVDALEKALNEYRKGNVRNFARQASLQEAQCYEWIDGDLRTKIPRIEETMQFASKMGYKKLGLVFCLGLANEAATLSKIIEKKGFEVTSVCCKVGGIAKEEIGLRAEEKIMGPDGYEAMCNPIGQAEVMNSENPDLVIMLGLCVGHDSLFIQYCRRPITVMAVKDRVLAHNPLGALYTSSSPYYGRLRSK